MNTLILNGSPRKNGDTVALIQALTRTLPGQVECLDTYTYDAAPCIDCRYCWQHPGCAVQDGMQQAYERIIQADAIVLASPVFYGTLSGSLLSFASRLQTFYAAKYIRKDGAHPQAGKAGGVLLAAGGGTKDFTCALNAAHMILGLCGAKPLGAAVARDTDCYGAKAGTPAKMDEAALGQAKALGEHIGSFIQTSCEEEQSGI